MAKNSSVAAINASVFLLMCGVGLIVSLLPQRILDLSGSLAQVGYLAGSYAVGNILFQLPVGRLADRLGFKGFLVAGYLFCALSGLLFFVSDSVFVIYLGRFIQGIGEVPVWALAPALLSIYRPLRKGRYMGIYNACLHAGLTTGGLLSMTLFSHSGGNGAFLLFAFLSLAGAILTAVFVANPQKNVEPGSLGNISSPRPGPVFQNRSIRVILAAVLLYGAGYGMFVTLIPGFLIRAKGMDQTGIGLFFTLFYIALSFSQLVAGPVSDHRGKRSVMLAGLAPACLGLAMFWALPNTWSLVFLFAVGAGLGVFCISSMARLNESVPESLKGTVSGAFFFSWAFGYCVGPMALGQVGRIFGYPTVFMALAGLMGLAFFAVLFFVSSKEQRSHVKVMEMSYPSRRKRGNGSF